MNNINLPGNFAMTDRDKA